MARPNLEAWLDWLERVLPAPPEELPTTTTTPSPSTTTPAPQIPLAPENFIGTLKPNSKIDFAWMPSSGAVFYNLHVLMVDRAKGTKTTLGPYKTLMTQYKDVYGPTAGYDKTFWVTAVNSLNESKASNMITFSA